MNPAPLMVIGVPPREVPEPGETVLMEGAVPV
jgi:hypothetical protein